MSTAAYAGKFSAMSTKFQVGTAALAIATAATITPVAAHAAPSLVSFAEGIGNSAEQLLQPVVVARPIPQAAASANASTPVCDTETIACALRLAVQGIASGAESVVVGLVQAGGAVVWVTLAITAGVVTAIGDALPGPLGDFISQIGATIKEGADAVAKATGNGAYV